VTRQPTAPLPGFIYRLAAAPSPLSDGDCLERFTAGGDGTAFETLVRRHGPVVFRVCRSVLGDAHAAEDAFQATFLTLARQAASLRKHRSLGSWLYKVGYRIARDARQKEESRAAREHAVSLRAAANPVEEASWREVQAIFFEEVAGLPERYRAPLLLCCLEAKTRDEAAEQLGCATGTLKIRLERGRKLLRARLARRGLGLSAGLLAVRLAPAGARAAVPESLTAISVRAGAALHVGGAAAGLVSARVVSLSDKAGRAAIFDHLKTVLAAALLCGACVAGGVSMLFRAGVAAAPPDTPAPAERPAAVAESVRTDALGDPLPADALSRFGSLRLRHAMSVYSACFTPDGKTLVSAGMDGVRTWDVATGKQVHAFPEKATAGWEADVLLTPDGKYLFTADDAGIHQWEVATAKYVRPLTDGKHRRVRISPDGKLIAAIPEVPLLRTVKVLEVDSGRLLWSREPGSMPLNAITFSSDGQTLVATGSAGPAVTPQKYDALYLLDARTGKERRWIALGYRTPYHVVLSPDGSRLAALCFGAKDGKRAGRPLYVIDAASGKDLLCIDPPGDKADSFPGHFSALAFMPGSRSLITAGSHPGLIEWDFETGRELRRFGGDAMSTDSRGAIALALSPDGNTVAVGCDPAIRLIDRESGRATLLPSTHSANSSGSAITPDGGTVVTPGPGATVYFWDPATGRVRNRLNVEQSARSGYLLAADGKTALGREYPGKGFVVCELPSGKLRSRLSLDRSADVPRWLTVAPDGKTVAERVCGSDSFQLIDTTSGKPLKSLQDPDFKGSRASFTADGRTLFVFCTDHTAQVWDVAGGVRLRRIGPMRELSTDRPPAPPRSADVDWGWYAIAVSPDGARIAADDEAGHLLLFDADTGRELQCVDNSDTDGWVVVFSPDGRTLARDKKRGKAEEPAVQLIEVASGRERYTFHGHRGPCRALTFSADGKFLVSGSTDTTALVWDLTGRLAGGKAWDKPLSPAELDGYWAALADADAAKAYAAVQRLAAADNAVAYLRELLRPVAAADENLLARLIADLDGDRFEVREKATSELEKLGEVAIPAIQKALAARPPAETRRRLEALMNTWVRIRQNPAGNTLRKLRALEVLERVGTPDARRVLETIANGLPDARLTREAMASAERLAKRPAAP
jgi:RNA polymerase sigma factor (sigma-70 family)